MLRRAALLDSRHRFNFVPIISHLRHVHIDRPSTLSFFNFLRRKISEKRSCCSEANMADVLKIIGPPENLFPSLPGISFYVSLLKKCIKINDIVLGRVVHVHFIKLGFGRDRLLSNVLLDVYVKLGSSTEYSHLFDEISDRDLVSCSTVLSGFVRHGFDLEAFRLFKLAHVSELKPNNFMISSVLKACSASGVLEFGLQIHGFSTKSGFASDGFVEIGLVDMYAKCGSIYYSCQVFNETRRKNSVCWNTMISGFVHRGFLKDAIVNCLEMCRTGLVMDLVTIRIAMSVGSALDRFSFCKNIFLYSIKTGLDWDRTVILRFLRLLGKVGEVVFMHKLFNTIEKPDAVLFSFVISRCYLQGCRREAVVLSRQLIASDLNFKQEALVSILNMCCSKDEGTQIHGHILRTGYESYLPVSDALISVYIRCNTMKDAYLLLFKMPSLDQDSRMTIVRNHVWNNQFREALKHFCAYRKDGLSLDHYLVATVINACSRLRALVEGKQIHTLALILGIKLCDFVVISLLDMYANCGHMHTCSRLFSLADCPHNLVTVNVMLSGYLWNKQPERTLELFIQEYNMGFVPNRFSFSTILGACADLRSIETGEHIFSCIIKTGFALFDMVVGNAVVNLYMKCSSVDRACKLFYSMKIQDSKSCALFWLAYLNCKSTPGSLTLTSQMHESRLSPSSVTFLVVLRSVNIVVLKSRKQLHVSILRRIVLSDSSIRSAVVGVYSKSSFKDDLRDVLSNTVIGDDLSWNTTITAFSQIGNRDTASKVVKLMRQETSQVYNVVQGVSSICAGEEALVQGLCVPGHVIWVSLVLDVCAWNAVVDMHGKFRRTRDFWKVSGTLEIGDLISWNTMVSGYKSTCICNESLNLLKLTRTHS